MKEAELTGSWTNCPAHMVAGVVGSSTALHHDNGCQ